MGLSINKNLKRNRSIQWYTTAELGALQKQKLFAILSHCNNHIPYYQKLFKDYSLNINGDLLHELKKIPILTKKIIKKHLFYSLHLTRYLLNVVAWREAQLTKDTKSNTYKYFSVYKELSFHIL